VSIEVGHGGLRCANRPYGITSPRCVAESMGVIPAYGFVIADRGDGVVYKRSVSEGAAMTKLLRLYDFPAAFAFAAVPASACRLES